MRALAECSIRPGLVYLSGRAQIYRILRVSAHFIDTCLAPSLFGLAFDSSATAPSALEFVILRLLVLLLLYLHSVSLLQILAISLTNKSI
jgi:hypothetical protein